MASSRPPSGIQFAYLDEAGELIAHKKRTALKATEGSYWPKGQPLAAYGSWRIDQARRAGTLYLMEGESDTLTLWLHDLPALGLPGANSTACLTADHLAGITHLFISREPDRGGQTFVEGVLSRLRALGWEGAAYELRMPDGIKDASELHMQCREGDAFLAAFQERLHAVPQIWPDTRTISVVTENDIDELALPDSALCPALREEAFHGIVGEIVRTVEPETEASPAGLLIQLLVACGSAIGRSAYARVEGDMHYTNLFALTVGRSGHGRKGTSWGRVRQVMQLADQLWAENCITGGLSSGEGLIYRVRDSRVAENADGNSEIVDQGVKDKRLLVVETEFGQVLRNMKRESNTLSAIMRHGWDHGNMSTLTKTPLKATAAHVAIIAQITQKELHCYLDKVELFNGFANRFLWALVKRSKLLPDGGRELDLHPLGLRLNKALAGARRLDKLERSDEAREMWEKEYRRLTDGRPGLWGVVTSRAEAQVLVAKSQKR